MKLKSGTLFKFFFFNTTLLLFSLSNSSIAQENKVVKAYDKYTAKVGGKTEAFNYHLQKTDTKYLKKYFRNENKLFKKLCKQNPVLADHLFSVNSDPLFYHQKDKNVSQVLRNKPSAIEYFPYKDTLQSSLTFLKKNKPESIDDNQLEKANTEATKLDHNLSGSDNLQQYFRHRKESLKELAHKYPELGKSIKGYDKVNYYYHEQIAEYKRLFADPNRIEATASKYLKSNVAFKQFMSKNGVLSGFEKIPANWGKDISGLQTILQTKDMMQKEISAIGSNPKDIIEEKMQPMQQTLGKLKSGNYGNVSNAADIPNFKPNPLKTKRLIDRLEFGNNYQFTQTNTFYPSSSNIAMQVAYHISTKIKPGVGLSYILGMGTGWNHVRFSQEGIGLRSFIDYKVGKLFNISGGYEKNSIPPSIQQKEKGIQSWHWNESLLCGLKLKYNAVKKLSPTFSLQYDFLSDHHTPSTPALIYRAGWEFGK